MKLSDTAILKPVSTLAIAAALCVVGIYSFTGIPVNLLPDITYPLVKVYVYWTGATPEEIEDNIADVIEPKMATVDDLDYLESNIVEGQYQLLVNFTYDADRDVAYQDVLAKMGLVRKKLPKDADEPQILKADPSQLPVIDLMVTSKSMDMTRLRSWVENELQYEFSAVEGSAGTEVSGGKNREIRILLDPYRMQATGVTIDKVAQRLRDENLELAAGRVISGKKDFTVRSLSRFSSIDEIASIVIEPDKYGASIMLKDVADVKDASAIQRIVTGLGGAEGVKISIFKQAAANTITVEEGIQKKLTEVRKRLPVGVSASISYNQATYIRSANKGVRDTAVLAGILVLLVTIVFLSGWRQVVMIALTLPVSLLGTFACMKLLGFSFNILSMGGLVVAFTVILDNGLVVLENITRLRGENNSDPIRTGTNQVAKPVFFSTLTFIAIFLPFLMVPGLTSLLFRELVITVAIVVAFSLLTSLTIIPALSRLLFTNRDNATSTESKGPGLSDRVMGAITARYAGFLRFILLRGKVVSVLLLTCMLGLSILWWKSLGSEFLPKADDGMITVKVKLPTGSAMQQTAQVLKSIEKSLVELPFVESYNTLIGGRIWGLVTTEMANEGEIGIQLVPKGKRNIATDAYVEKYRQQVVQSVKYPGVIVKAFHTKMKGIRSTGDFDIEAEVYAPKTIELPQLFAAAQKVMATVKDVDGVGNLDMSIDLTKPEYHFVADRERCADLGVTPAQAAQALRALIDGQVATTYEDDGFFYPVRVMVDESKFGGVQDIRNVPLPVKNATVLLSDLGTVERRVGPVGIDRKNQMRLIKISGTVVSGDVGTVTDEVYAKLAGVTLPAGAFIKAGGQAQAMRENNAAMMTVILLGIFFAFILLTIQFESLRLPLIVLLAIPFVMTGFIGALYLARVPLGVTAIIGIVVLLGMLINHWVLVLSFMEEHAASGKNILDAVVTAASLRLRPILMTFLTDVLGLMPFLLNIGEGTEMLRPLGIAVIGGITWSLLVTFIFVPIVFYAVNGARRNHQMEGSHEQ
jgi:multidrug efflux pump subunit AcrB